MRVAILGCAGSVGKRVVFRALDQGHTVVGVDLASTYGSMEHDSNSEFTYTKLDLREYDQVLKVLHGCHAVVQLAALRNPGDYAVQTHNTWVFGTPLISCETYQRPGQQCRHLVECSTSSSGSEP